MIDILQLLEGKTLDQWEEDFFELIYLKHLVLLDSLLEVLSESQLIDVIQDSHLGDLLVYPGLLDIYHSLKIGVIELASWM